MGMTTVMAHCPGSPELDATCFYRGFRPIASLRRIMDMSMVSLYKPEVVTFDLISYVDVAFIQRPYATDQLLLMKKLKSWNVPLWIDYDDDLFNVPPSNRAFPTYRRPDVRENMRQAIEMADVVTVTTEYLKNQIKHPDVRVIPNALDNYLFNRTGSIQAKQNICWRGNDTHFRDLWTVTQQIVDVAKKDQGKWTWTWMGWNPTFITEHIPADKQFFTDPMPIFPYFEALKKNAAAIHIAPLDSCVFNYSKSNIAYLEATLAGSVVICPKWPQWQEYGTINYENPQSFGAALDHAMGMDAGEIQELNDEAWDNIRRKYLLSEVNKLRMDLVQEIKEKRRRSICVAMSSKISQKTTRTKRSKKLAAVTKIRRKNTSSERSTTL